MALCDAALASIIQVPTAKPLQIPLLTNHIEIHPLLTTSKSRSPFFVPWHLSLSSKVSQLCPSLSKPLRPLHDHFILSPLSLLQTILHTTWIFHTQMWSHDQTPPHTLGPTLFLHYVPAAWTPYIVSGMCYVTLTPVGLWAFGPSTWILLSFPLSNSYSFFTALL